MSLKFVRELAQMIKNVSWPVFCTKSVVIFYTPRTSQTILELRNHKVVELVEQVVKLSPLAFRKSAFTKMCSILAK